MSINSFFKATLPMNMSFKDWSIQIQQDLPHIKFPIPSGFITWQSWACQIVRANPLNNIPLPIGENFSEKKDWKKWAEYFISSLK